MSLLDEQKNYIGDARISSHKQQQGESLENQEKVIRNFTKPKGWNELKMFSKVFSGRAEERDDFEEIIDFIKETQKKGTKVHYYVVKSIDRFTRGGAIAYEEMKERLNRLGVTLTDVYGFIQPEINTLEWLGVDYDWSKKSPTASSQLMEAQRANDEVSDLLTRMIGQEICLVRDGYKAREANEGYLNDEITVNGKKKTIHTEDPKKGLCFIAMYNLRIQELEDPEITKRVNAMGFRSKLKNKWDKKREKVIGQSGGKLLTVKQLQKYIQNPIYAGVVCEKWTNYQPIRAQWKGLVSIETFNRANKGKIFIKENANGTLQILRNYSPDGTGKKKRLRHNPLYPFKFIPCPFCKLPMLGSASRGKRKIAYAAYHCGGKAEGPRSHKYFRVLKEEFEANIKAFVETLTFQKDFWNAFELVLNDTYRTRECEIVSQSSKISLNVGELKEEQAACLKTLTVTHSEIARRKLEEQIDTFEHQIEEAQNQREEIEITERDIKSFIKAAKYIMEHPVEILINTEDLYTQRMLFGLVFDEMPTYEEILNGTPKLSLVFAKTKPQHSAEDLLVTPRRTVMNFYEKAGELLPLVMAWNTDVAAFLKREPAEKTLAVTY